MLTVTNLAGETEALNGIQGFEKIEDVDRNLSVKFTSIEIPNNPGHPLIKEESLIVVDDLEFRVKQLKDTRGRKEVGAISIFYDLKGVRQDEIYGGTKTFSEFVTFALKGTGWTFTSNGLTDSRLIENFGESNVVKLIEVICAVYECEVQILPGKKLYFAKEIGGDYDAQYRYGHNVKSLSSSVDTTKLRTRIKGYGADSLVVTYTSPNHEKFGYLDEEPVRDEKFSTSESMTEHLRRTLVDEPEVTFEMDTVELTTKELGERVWLIYEPLGIEMKTRILSKTQGLRNDELYTKSVVIGNKIPTSLEDILISQRVEIDSTNQEFRSRFDQTNSLIKLEVEQVEKSIASLSLQSDEIKLSVTTLGNNINNRVDGVVSSVGELSVKSDKIALSVTQVGGRVDQVDGKVDGVNGRVQQAEASITLQAGQISSKVSETDFNGNTIVSKINQTPAYVSIEASKINLTGYVTINSLNTPGHVTINEGNIVGSSFTVGRGSGNPQLSMYATQGSHRILSSDGAGFRVESTGTMSLKSGSGNPITMLGFTRVEGNLSVEPSGGGTPILATNVSQSKVAINGLLEVTSIMVGGKQGVPALFT